MPVRNRCIKSPVDSIARTLRHPIFYESKNLPENTPRLKIIDLRRN